MRKLVEPPRSVHCDLCDGELRLKLIETGNATLDLDVETFVCAKCGHEHVQVVNHDHYAAHTASKIRPAGMG